MSNLNQAVVFYREAFENLRDTDTAPQIFVEYYPYVNTSHTIRYREEKILVRISDAFRDAPEDVHKALAYILVAKLLGKRAPGAVRQRYRSFVQSEDFVKGAVLRKRDRGRKYVSSPIGERFDLEEMFNKLNREYFESNLSEPDLTWSKKPTFRRLGHHDSAHDTIVISRSLDARGVPEFVVEYVLYHEMLHLVHPVISRNGRRYIHTAEFRKDESKFVFAEEAEEWIFRNAGALKKYAKKHR